MSLKISLWMATCGEFTSSDMSRVLLNDASSGHRTSRVVRCYTHTGRLSHTPTHTPPPDRSLTPGNTRFNFFLFNSSFDLWRSSSHRVVCFVFLSSVIWQKIKSPFVPSFWLVLWFLGAIKYKHVSSAGVWTAQQLPNVPKKSLIFNFFFFFF